MFSYIWVSVRSALTIILLYGQLKMDLDGLYWKPLRRRLFTYNIVNVHNIVSF